ncbi:glucan biosynthesis protein G [Pseudooceanicola sp. CBS1P-1]|uniref:Glucan biosynthesis protein D n=1 Tax=Pseudooceanicola albus TaxID=2692189 RepID=A0A6L7G1X4_9RHOB|nr:MULTISPECIES: glucan biosynthesis protein G [Pseudooceanicola]MBT9384950.1 glucan biosynthesis protein G [Pseudooceanicola endophyticus]MXN18055.1 glucan biosynthesis protein D [Pseudooceanicola albus]
MHRSDLPSRTSRPGQRSSSSLRHLASPSRRRLLRQLAGSSALAVVGLPALAQEQPAQTDQNADAAAPAQPAVPAKQPFSFDWLAEQMQQLSTQAPRKPEAPQGFLTKLDYDSYQRIQFDPAKARWQDEGQEFRVLAYQLGWLYKAPVELYEVVDGQATPMIFNTTDFIYHKPLNVEIPDNFAMPGVAGFRLNAQLNRADKFDELVAFLGASYFRALGRDNRYGLSARGLAVNTGLSGNEEFPRFTAFWLERPAPGQPVARVYASLESESCTGAYAFTIRPGETTIMDVKVKLFTRNDIQQVGIAPLTSMFLFGGPDRGDFEDFRPGVHDSDALILQTGANETFFRPLKNPPRLATSYLWAMNPKKFGLIQRNRIFADYLDAQARYDLRPSLTIEPQGDWGEGNICLVEIPSDQEGNDNIVAFWVPKDKFVKGASYDLSYRMAWGMSPGSENHELAQVIRTRSGHAGVAGSTPAKGRRKFVIDYVGGLMAELPADATVKPEIEVSGGKVTEAIVSPIEGQDIWRLAIDVESPGDDIMEIKASLNGYGRRLSETWVYQWMKE